LLYVLRPAPYQALSALSVQILEDNIVQHVVRPKALEFGVFICQRFQAMGVKTIPVTNFGLELVKRPRAQAMSPGHLSRWHPGIVPLVHPDNLASVERLCRVCLHLGKLRKLSGSTAIAWIVTFPWPEAFT